MLGLQVWATVPGYTALGIEPRASCLLGEYPTRWTTSPIDVGRHFMAIYSEFSFLGIQSEFLWLLLLLNSFVFYFETGFCHVALGGPKLLAFLSQPSKRQIDVNYLTWLPPQFLTGAMKHVGIVLRLFKRRWCKWSAQFTCNNFLIWKIWGGSKLWSLRAEYLKGSFP